MEIQIVLTTDNSLFARIARWLGAEFTHAMLRWDWAQELTDNLADLLNQPHPINPDPYYHIIEAGFRHGVVERAWNAEEYSKWAVYRLKEPMELTGQCVLQAARERLGDRYAFEKLPLLVPLFIRRLFLRFSCFEGRYTAMLTFDRAADICTSLVDDCFFECDFDLVSHIDTPWVLPDDIRDSPLLEKIEEGR